MPRKAKSTPVSTSTSAQVVAAGVPDESPSWGLVLFQGIVTFLLGWLLIARPVTSVFALVQVMGLFWLITGVISIVRSLVHHEKNSGWGWTLVSGLIGVVAGLVVLNNRVMAAIITPTMLLYILSFSFIIDGVIKMIWGKRSADMVGPQRSWGSFFGGLFYTFLGIALLAMPLIVALQTLVLSAGLLAVMAGIFLMISAFQVKQYSKQVVA